MRPTFAAGILVGAGAALALVLAAWACGAGASTTSSEPIVVWRGASVDEALVPTLDAAWAYAPRGAVSVAARADWEPAGWRVIARPVGWCWGLTPGGGCGRTSSSRRIELGGQAVDAAAWELANARCLDLRGVDEFRRDAGWRCV